MAKVIDKLDNDQNIKILHVIDFDYLIFFN
jgi:hypothetical protein